MHNRFDDSPLPVEWQKAIAVARDFTERLNDTEALAVMGALNERMFPESTAKVRELVIGGLTTDGAHHKQWFLEQLAEAFKVDLTGVYYVKGIAP